MTQPHEHGGGFLPHGYCYLWDQQLLWTHVLSDFFIGAAYVTISVSLAWLVHRVRRDIPFSWAFVAFGLFIITCAMTHFMEIWTMWQPVYWLSGGVKVVTAVASVATAVAMPFTVPRAIATVRDARLSRQRELAEVRAQALEEQNERLQAALAEAERARLIAEAANDAKNVFLRTMSHELRTPLNAVIGYAQLIEVGSAGPITDQQQHHLHRIGRSAAHLLNLIDEVLTLTRASADHRAPHGEPVVLSDIVREVVEMSEPQAELKGLALRTGDIPSVELVTDPLWLRQILINLMANAIKFTERGSVEIRGETQDGALLLHVRDTGLGIAAEHLDRVFEPFWQVDQGTTRTQGGTGLGLTVSRDLAVRLGGEITVASALGDGTRFTLRLPLR